MAQRPVRRVMLSPVPAVAEATSLRRVAHVLLDTGLPGLPVTDACGPFERLCQPHRYLAGRGSRPAAGFMWG